MSGITGFIGGAGTDPRVDGLFDTNVRRSFINTTIDPINVIVEITASARRSILDYQGLFINPNPVSVTITCDINSSVSGIAANLEVRRIRNGTSTVIHTFSSTSTVWESRTFTTSLFATGDFIDFHLLSSGVVGELARIRNLRMTVV